MQVKQRGSRVYLLRAIYSPEAKRSREFFVSAADADRLVLEPTELPANLPAGWGFLEQRRGDWSELNGEEQMAWQSYCSDRHSQVVCAAHRQALDGLVKRLQEFTEALRQNPTRAVASEAKWVAALNAARTEIQDLARLHKRKEKAVKRVEESEAARQAKKAGATTPPATTTD